MSTNERITSSSEVKESKEQQELITLTLTREQYRIVSNGLNEEWFHWFKRANRHDKAGRKQKAKACVSIRNEVFEVEQAIKNQVFMRELPGALA